MCFTWLNKQGVSSDKGFQLQTIDRFTMEYSEGNKTITVSVEDGMLNGVTPCIIIWPDAFQKWDDSCGGTPLSLDKQSQVLQNFKDALEFQDLALSVETTISDQK